MCCHFLYLNHLKKLSQTWWFGSGSVLCIKESTHYLGDEEEFDVSSEGSSSEINRLSN